MEGKKRRDYNLLLRLLETGERGVRGNEKLSQGRCKGKKEWENNRKLRERANEGKSEGKIE